MRIITWHRNDLRLHDNPLYANLKAGMEILPVYIINPDFYNFKSELSSRIGPFRAKFLAETLDNLADSLHNKGLQLNFFEGKPAEVLERLVKEHNIDEVWATREHSAEEIADEREASRRIAPARLRLFDDRTLIQPDRLPFAIGHLPDVFTEFRKKVEGYSSIAPLLPEMPAVKMVSIANEHINKFDPARYGIPPAIADQRANFDFRGGETEALKRLRYYFHQSHRVATYKETRNGLLGGDYSTRFSPWLANGSLSPRMIYHELRNYEKTFGSSQNTYWMFFELLWRDYARFVVMKYGNRIFKPGGIRNADNPCQMNPLSFEKWRTGNTGNDFVDANMRELLLTGWMSNRGRQNVASYLVKDLKICWIYGAAWFETQLIDYDVCSNYVNWMYVAGVGNDPRENRYFNTRKQAAMYDPDNNYRKLWLK